eukprot:1872025-Rhodomonas_salina.1
MSGTLTTNGTVALRACYAMSGTNRTHGPIPYALLCDVRGTVLRACYAMSGTHIAYGTIAPCPAMRCPRYSHSVWLYRPTRGEVLADAFIEQARDPIALRAATRCPVLT